MNIITGTNFLKAAVTFAAVTAAFSVSSRTQITATVPAGASNGRIRVTTAVASATSSSNFNVTGVAGPTITSCNPTSGPVGTSVTINGTNFLGATSVTFDNVAASFSVTNATRIVATVPSGATTGRIRVRTPAGTATSGTNFQVTSPLVRHARDLSFGLSGHLRARGIVSVADGFAACAAQVPVKIQREVSGRWRTLLTILTHADGSFGVHLQDRRGMYRARATKLRPSSGNVCVRTTSRARHHGH